MVFIGFPRGEKGEFQGISEIFPLSFFNGQDPKEVCVYGNVVVWEGYTLCFSCLLAGKAVS